MINILAQNPLEDPDERKDLELANGDTGWLSQAKSAAMGVFGSVMNTAREQFADSWLAGLKTLGTVLGKTRGRKALTAPVQEFLAAAVFHVVEQVAINPLMEGLLQSDILDDALKGLIREHRGELLKSTQRIIGDLSVPVLWSIAKAGLAIKKQVSKEAPKTMADLQDLASGLEMEALKDVAREQLKGFWRGVERRRAVYLSEGEVMQETNELARFGSAVLEEASALFGGTTTFPGWLMYRARIAWHELGPTQGLMQLLQLPVTIAGLIPKEDHDVLRANALAACQIKVGKKVRLPGPLTSEDDLLLRDEIVVHANANHWKALETTVRELYDRFLRLNDKTAKDRLQDFLVHASVDINETHFPRLKEIFERLTKEYDLKEKIIGHAKANKPKRWEQLEGSARELFEHFSKSDDTTAKRYLQDFLEHTGNDISAKHLARLREIFERVTATKDAA